MVVTSMPKNGADFWRQLGILAPSAMIDVIVHVIGVGGIGSPTALTLAKMGIPRIVIWDDDIVDTHNFPSQLYRWQDLNEPKVKALGDILAEFTPAEVVVRSERYTAESEALTGIVICAVDTMTARKEIWDRVRGNPDVTLYVEARMGAEVLRVHAVNPNDPDDAIWYGKTLYSDEDAIEAPCTEHAIIYTVMAAAAIIGDIVKKHIRNEEMRREVIFDLVNLELI